MGQSRSKREQTRASSTPKDASVDFGGEWSASNVDFEEAAIPRSNDPKRASMADSDKAYKLMSKRDKDEVLDVANRRNRSFFAQPKAFTHRVQDVTKELAGQRGAYTTKPGGDIKVSKKKDKHK